MSLADGRNASEAWAELVGTVDHRSQAAVLEHLGERPEVRLVDVGDEDAEWVLAPKGLELQHREMPELPAAPVRADHHDPAARREHTAERSLDLLLESVERLR
jgi:hypothetical protein